LDFEFKISKYLNNQSTPEEIQELYQLIQNSEQDRTEFAKLKNMWVFTHSQMQGTNKSEGFDKVMNRINQNFIKRKTFSIVNIYRYAASFLLPLFIAGITWLYYANYIV
jgi:hypothetical protein